jgi:predicted acetyltransferase
LDVELAQVGKSAKSVLRQLLELYNYDFSEYDGADVNAHGLYGYRYLDHYWTEETRHPFFILVDGQLAGLVLINEHCYIAQEPGSHSIAEFFVMRKYRKKGVGRTAACKAFDMFPGKWEVLQHGQNIPSIRFWETVIGEYTSDRFARHPVSTQDWDGQALVFNTCQ